MIIIWNRNESVALPKFYNSNLVTLLVVDLIYQILCSNPFDIYRCILHHFPNELFHFGLLQSFRFNPDFT